MCFFVCVCVFFKKLKMSKGHSVGHINIFHFNLKCQLRFRHYLEKGDKVHWALWLDQLNSNAKQTYFKVAELVVKVLLF